MTTVRRALLAIAVVAASVAPARAANQALSLQAGWNLVSFAVTPEDPSPAAVLTPLGSNLLALWTYDAASGTWSTFPDPPQGVPAITTIVTGRGYWLKVTRNQVLVVDGDDTLPAAPPDLVPDWNLVGFPIDEPVNYDRLLGHRAVREIWTYDETVRTFDGVELDPRGIPLTPTNFGELRPGKGYWVRVEGETVSLTPVLASALPPDRDVPPLVPNPSTEERVAWLDRNPGDVDVGGDGFYDRSKTQRAVDLGDDLESDTLSVFNTGAGVLLWKVAVVDPAASPWLRLRVTDPFTDETRLVTEDSGAVATETDVVELVADRTGYGPGTYRAQLRLTSNGADRAAPEEPERTVDVFMGVADLLGDYRLKADLATVDGKSVDLPQPRLSLSVYRDSEGLKAIVDPRTTLLVSNPVRMVGDIYQSGTTRFVLSGSFEVSASDPNNPFQAAGAAVRRDITLIGSRREKLDEPIGPADLRGEYRETLRFRGAQGELRAPIYLAGTFTAQRTSRRPSTLDVKEQRGPGPENIPDGTGAFEQSVDVADRQIITEVDVNVDVQHARPDDLVISIRGPDCHLEKPVQCRTRLLRNRTTTPLLTGPIVYDDEARPFESLDVFRGMSSAGRWTLRVEDQVETATGTVRSWSIRLRGTRVASVKGTVAGVGEGATVLLTGCGKILSTTTAADGSYRFDDLVDCLYRVTVQQSGFQRTGAAVALGGTDATGVDLAPPAAPPDQPVPVDLPAGPGTRFQALTTAAGAGAEAECLAPGDGDSCKQPLVPVQGGRLRYVLDGATFDVDRPPLGGEVGDEDSNRFLDAVNPSTTTNLPGANDRIDGPAGARSRQAFVALGMPVIGPAWSAGRQLMIGPNP